VVPSLPSPAKAGPFFGSSWLFAQSGSGLPVVAHLSLKCLVIERRAIEGVAKLLYPDANAAPGWHLNLHGSRGAAVEPRDRTRSSIVKAQRLITIWLEVRVLPGPPRTCSSGFALGRKSWLFAGSERGADRAAAMTTL
jgi:hypothetical protein